MSGLGTPDFFYREAQRLGYVARSAFKLLQMQKQYKLIAPGDSVLDLGCAPGAWLQVACQSLGHLKNGGAVVGIDLKVRKFFWFGDWTFLFSCSRDVFRLLVYVLELVFCLTQMAFIAEQKVKVPSIHCDSRVQTVSADVMELPREQVMAFSPKGRGFSVILSDMCPSVSGITMKDTILSGELAKRALLLAIGRNRLSGLDEYSFLFESEDASRDDPDAGVLQPKGNLVMKLLESEENQRYRDVCRQLFQKASWLRPKATRSSSKEIYLVCLGLGKAKS
ncbi:Ribosomal RNA large subunit methyltransferase E [Nymphaea thermarum]|nr:Ribosomal RNA large subunit methyltransferase E [Nymphaea thermarum]